jgi:hypothetical protein
VRLLRRRQGAHAQATDRELRLQRCDVVARRDVVVRLPPRAGSVKKSNGKGVVDVRSKVTAGHRRDRSQLAANLAGDALLKEAKVKKVVCSRKNGSDGGSDFGEECMVVIACVCRCANRGTKHEYPVCE